MSIAADFTVDEIECLIHTAAEMVAEYGTNSDVLSAYQIEVAEKAWRLVKKEQAQ